MLRAMLPLPMEDQQVPPHSQASVLLRRCCLQECGLDRLWGGRDRQGPRSGANHREGESLRPVPAGGNERAGGSQTPTPARWLSQQERIESYEFAAWVHCTGEVAARAMARLLGAGHASKRVPDAAEGSTGPPQCAQALPWREEGMGDRLRGQVSALPCQQYQ